MVCGGAVNSWDYMLRRSGGNQMALSTAWSGLRLVQESECGQLSRIISQLQTTRRPTSTTPSSPRDSRTCRALLHLVEWTRSKCRYRAPTWRNVAMSVETEPDEGPWSLLRYRLLRG